MSGPGIPFDDDGQAQAESVAREAKKRRAQEINDLKRVLATDYGRRYYWRLLTICGMFKTSFTGNSATFFNEGQRNIALLMWAEVTEACPEMLGTMIRENDEKGRNTDA